MDKNEKFTTIDEYIDKIVKYNETDEFSFAFELIKEAGNYTKI